MGARVTLSLLSVLCAWTVLAGAPTPDAASPLPAGRSEAEPHRDCSACHSGAATTADGKPGRPDASVCVSCHWDLVRRIEAVALASSRSGQVGSGHVTLAPVSGERVPPGGSVTLASLDCLSCHTPHPNENPHQLRVGDRSGDAEEAGEVDPISRSCLRCHGAFLQTRRQGSDYTLHPIGVPVPSLRTHDGGPELPLTDGKLTCTTCHLVHGSPNPDLLRWSRDEFATACTSCHAAGGARESSPQFLAFGGPRR
jgi:predicted CXXCH cytochrome family protein